MISTEADDRTGILTVVVSGSVTVGDIQHLAADLARAAEDQGRLRVLQIVKEVTSLEPSGIWQQIVRYMQHDDPGGKAAIVVDEDWQVYFNELLQPFVGSNIRIFEPHDVELARSWLMGRSDSGVPIGGGTS